MEATMREYDVDYIWLRSPSGVPLGVVMTPPSSSCCATPEEAEVVNRVVVFLTRSSRACPR